MQPSQPYPGAYGPARQVESYLSKRMVFALNAVGLFGWWLGGVLAAFSRDANVLNLARFLVVSGGAIGGVFIVGGALGAERATDMLNNRLVALGRGVPIGNVRPPSCSRPPGRATPP